MECYISLEYNTFLSFSPKSVTFFFFPETPSFLTCSYWRPFLSDSSSHACLSISPSKLHFYLLVAPSALSTNTHPSPIPSVSPLLSPHYPFWYTYPWLPISKAAPAHPAEHWFCVSRLSYAPESDFQSA